MTDTPRTRRAILGISAYYHDSAAVLLMDGKIVAAAQEERFTRKKHDPDFPHHAARYCLAEAGLSPADLECVAFYDKPYLKFERLLETYHAFAPRGLRSFLTAMPVWIREKLFMRKMLKDELAKLGPASDKKGPEIMFPEHHLSHAASAFFPSPYEDAAVLTIDGVGEWATTTIGHGKGNELSILRELHFPHSLGLLYSALTAWCGFKVNSGEYKLMGLAPYGIEGSERVERYRTIILDQMVDLRPDGSLLLNMDYFDYATGLTMCRAQAFEAALGLPQRTGESDITQEYMDLALAIQQITEEAVFRMAETARALTGSKNLVMAGGVALNCVANGKLLKRGTFENIWIQPAAGDAGGALGAALAAWHIGLSQPRTAHASEPGGDMMQGAYLGPVFSSGEIERACRRFGAPAEKYDDFGALCSRVSTLLAGGAAVGWFQGRMEYGPRALGGRSILGDPRHGDMQKKLNLKIKYREGFRPFAPSVLEERMAECFDLDAPSPYMLLVAPVAESKRKPLPEGYWTRPMYDRLYVERSELPAITHVDFSARIQSVSKATNPRYWQLIDTFRREQGCPVVVNTSFNVRGEPIVCTPADAYACFMRTEMDALVLGDWLLVKDNQPEWREEGDWRSKFELD
ncbi:MAG TPA: carbamoyltransferase [Humidesulfovibrio sp.]|uniref:carbamoyltransferase family protein n=1 Tax=Humidesulfovibrio sp. TaxID=2910988 RepID=UPI002C6E2541|nr:carbamoyltransferase [Humidesulfovibrio sp.]HWR03744.1 carbamoyltransferase [Humidesulfovibrio sp.]